MRPILELFRAVRRLQKLWRSARETTARTDVQSGVRDALAQLEAHERDLAGQIASVLSRADAPDVRERLEVVRADWNELARELRERLDQISGSEEGWRFVWDEIEDLLARRVRGAGVRTIDDPFGTLLAPAASAAPFPVSNERREEAAVATLSAQPDAGDLKPLSGSEPPPSVVSLVKKLGNDPERLFRFVAEEIALSLHAGWFRAPAEVLADRVGNDAELAGLLIELLRAAGVPARLATGNVRESLRNLGQRIDVADSSVLQRLIADSGRTAFFSGAGDEDVLVDLWDRFWVQAWLPLDGGSRWVDLDPSERTLDVQPGIGLSSMTTWSAAGEDKGADASLERRFLEDQDARGGPLTYFEAHLRDALTLSGVPADVPIESCFRTRRALPFPDFPPPLQGQRLSPPRLAQQFEDGQAWKISVQLVGVDVGTLLDETRPLPARNRAAWSLSWEPATAAAKAFLDSGRGLGGLPSFAVDLRPRIQIRGDDGTLEVIEGTAAITAGASVFVQIVLSAPVWPRTRRSEARIVAGESWVMRTEPPGADLVDRPIPDRLPAPSAGAQTTDVLLAALLEVYHRRLASVARRVAALGDAVSLTGPWVSLLGAHLEPLVVARHVAGQRRSSWLLDVKVIDHALYGSGDSGSRRGLEELFLAEGSYLEAEWFRALLARPATSTITALRQAAAEGTRLVTVHRGDDAALDALEQPPGVINALRMALATRSRSITIPQRPVRIGGREIAAWIARRDDTLPSEYAIAGLWGGILDDDDPEDPKDDFVYVVVTHVVNGALVDIGKSQDFTAFAIDGEGRDLTGSIRWDSLPSIGSGSGGQASFTSNATGGYLIRASVGGQGRQAGGAESGSYMATPAIDVKEIRFREPAVQLWHVQNVDTIVRLEGPIFSKSRRADPAGLWCGKTVEVELVLDVTFAADKTFRLRVKAEDPTGASRCGRSRARMSERARSRSPSSYPRSRRSASARSFAGALPSTRTITNQSAISIPPWRSSSHAPSRSSIARKWRSTSTGGRACGRATSPAAPRSRKCCRSCWPGARARSSHSSATAFNFIVG